MCCCLVSVTKEVLALLQASTAGGTRCGTKLQSLGLDLSQDQLDDVFKRFKVHILCTLSLYFICRIW